VVRTPTSYLDGPGSKYEKYVVSGKDRPACLRPGDSLQDGWLIHPIVSHFQAEGSYGTPA
jgi:hypothetical protein